MIWVLACVLVLAGGAWAGRRYYTASAPLGVPLPAPHPPIFTILPAEQANEVSWLNHTTVDPWLEFMAPQPDGLPPLRWTYTSELADFTIKHLHGTETTVALAVDENNVVTEAYGVLHCGWPLSEFTYQLVPRKASETVAEFVSRYEYELTSSGATLIGNVDPVDLPAYQLQHFEYEEAPRQGQPPASRFVYVGPLGSRVLVLTYKSTPELHEQARPFVMKIVHSLVPGWELKKCMLKENPQYGELAGTAIAEQPLNLPAAK